MCREKLTDRVCAIDFESFVSAREFLKETKIVKCGRNVEKFRIEAKLSLTALLSREQVDAHRVIKEQIRGMLTPADLIAMQARVRDIYVDPAVVEYAVRLVTATRHTFAAGLSDMKRYVSYGASPRASIALVTGARALAFLQGRDYVLPEDVSELALDVLRHRIVLSYEALADDVSPDVIITKVLDAVTAPDVVLSGR